MCLLDDDSGLCVGSMRGRVLFAGIAAARGTVVQSWFAPHMCGRTCWVRSLLRVVACGCAAAPVGGARPSTMDAWHCFLFGVRDCIKE